MNAVNYGNISTDDGGYFIERGSQNVIQQYKSRSNNNTNSITVTWKGRSTVAPSASPVVPVDTDFTMTGSPTNAVANYYDSQLNVSVRVYQRVV